MQPSKDPASMPSLSGRDPELQGRPTISINTFRAIAIELAEEFKRPIALCRRSDTTAGSTALPYQNKFLDLAIESRDEILEVIYPPEEGQALDPKSEALRNTVLDALAKAPGGERLDAYFGISSGNPKAPSEEAIESDLLINKLREVSINTADMSSILGDITRHVNQSGADPDILRALRGTKPKPAVVEVLPRKLAVTKDSIIGCLLGTAAGDSLGLPFEGLSPKRQQRLFGDSLQQCLILKKGMISDDTEHAAMLVQALIESGNDLKKFKENFAQRLKWWIAFVPSGVGFGTLRAGLKLWLGRSPDKSGVYSAGNGPCMRSPMLGLLFGDNSQQLFSFVRASSYITHTDPRAFSGALAVAVATHMSATTEKISPNGFIKNVAPALALANDKELLPLLVKAAKSADSGEATIDFAKSLGLEKGVSGFVLHTVPVAIHAWLRSPDDFRSAVEATIRCGGDTDTTSAIVGATVGARVKEAGLPSEWLQQIWEPTFSVSFLRNLGTILAKTHHEQRVEDAPEVPALKRIGRNALFFGIVLRHGIRRLFPPY